MLHRLFLLASLVASASVAAHAQAPASSVIAELAAGWAAVAAGDAGRAVSIAQSAASRYPGHAAVGALLVQAEVLRVGSPGALAGYELWLGGRTTEDPYLLRLIAVAFLQEVVQSGSGGEFQRLALRGLLDNGEGADAAVAAIGTESGARPAAAAEARALLGDEDAVRVLVERLQRTPGNRVGAIEALAATGSPGAVEPLIAVLNDPYPFNQMAAARALGQLRASQAIRPLRALLDNPQFAIKFAAAQALFELGDPTGQTFLGNVDRSSAMLRTQVLEATASDPSPGWLASVRQSLADGDPQVKLLAARLLAPHDPEAAEAALRELATDSNIAVVEAATLLYTETVASDFAELRQLLRHSSGTVRAKAAVRILELTGA